MSVPGAAGAVTVPPAGSTEVMLATAVAPPEEVWDAVAAGGAEVLVTLDPQAAVDAAERARPDRATAAMAEVIEGQRETLRATTATEVRHFEHLPVVLMDVPDLPALAELTSRPAVMAVSLPRTLRLESTAALALIGQPVAVQIPGFTGADVTVATVDSGVDWRGTTAFGNCTGGAGTGTCRVVRTADCTSGTCLTGDTECSAAGAPLDADFHRHGTHVAGVVAMTAPGARIASYRVFDGGSLCVSEGPSVYEVNLLAALDAVAGDAAALGIRVVNLSIASPGQVWSEPCELSPYSAAFAALRAAGVLPVVAAGNGGAADGVSSPACAPGAVAVGAVYSQAGSFSWQLCSDPAAAAGSVACFSQGGPLLDVLAPGVGITAAGLTRSGTSQAAPFAAAAAALVAGQRGPTWTPDDLEAWLTGRGPLVTDHRTGLQVHRIDLRSLVRGFRDVPESSPFAEQIAWAGDARITTGWPDLTFRPGLSVSRDAVAAMLFRAAHPGAAAEPCATAPFPDVPAGHPFCAEISWLAADGITTGFADGTFRPAAPVSRDAAAAFLARLWGPAELPPCTGSPFPDVPAGSPLCPGVQLLKQHGILHG